MKKKYIIIVILFTIGISLIMYVKDIKKEPIK